MPAGMFFYVYGSRLVMCSLQLNTPTQAAQDNLLSCAAWMGVFFVENLVIFLLLPLAILLSVRRKTRGQEKNYFFRPMSCGGGQVCYHSEQYKMF